MKHRILSLALALCVCVSSQSVAYAFQEVPVQQESYSQEDALPKENPDGAQDPDDSEEETPDTQEPPSQEVIPGGTTEDTEDPDGSEEETPDTQEPPSQEVIPGGTTEDTEDPDGSEEETPDMQDPPSSEEIPPEENLEDAETPEDTEDPDDSEEKTPVRQKDTVQEGKVYPLELPAELIRRDSTVPTPAEAYAAMIALKDLDMYKEGTTWTDDEPYASPNFYRWKGGPLGGQNIAAVGCVAFAFILSDAAFNSLPGRMYAEGEFSYEDIKVGDILRVSNDTHTVIVLEVSDAGVVVAEGNISTGDHVGKVHWGRGISKEWVMSNTSHYITRYPDGYMPPDDPEANDLIADGSAGGLTWKLTKAGTLTVSGQGAMPDYSSYTEQPWSKVSSQIRKVVIEEGVTNIGNCAFWNCDLISVEIPSSVTAIGNYAFHSSSIISVTIPANVKTIGNNAFYSCQNLSSVTISEGVEKIGQNAFRFCKSLPTIALPASIDEVGAAAFLQCTTLKGATFAPGSKQVKMGDHVFAGCYWLMGVTLPVNIDRIGEGMFMNCGMLAGVEIPQGAESIESNAFSSCRGMSTVIIPDSVKTIGTAAFTNCPLKDIYFTGTKAQWDSISKIGDTATAVSKATIHYNYTPEPDDGDDNKPGDGDDNKPDDGDDNKPDDGDDNKPGGGNNTGNNSNANKPGSNADGNKNNSAGLQSSKAAGDSGTIAVVEPWKPKTPEERKRYACLGKETVRYTPSKDNDYQITIENAMQGPMCFQSFEAVLGDYKIGRTYNIYSRSDNIYSMDEEVEFTIKIPSAVYKKNREYKMICVTKGGQPFVYNDLDSDPTTITIKTNKFYAYALIYR